MINLMPKGWFFVVFSFENQPVAVHIAKLLEKILGKPFGDGPRIRMIISEVERHVLEELERHFIFMDASKGTMTVKEITNAAAHHLAAWPGKKGLVIDPWNELEHWRPPNQSETEYISASLSALRNWSRRNHVHTWVVAHPQKMRRSDKGELPIPRPDMISGSQHWWNKADCCITVYRDLDKNGPLDEPETDIHVQKIRFKHIGRVGIASLHYDRVTGRYSEK